MRRPVRIIVLGVLCVLVGSCSAVDNLGNLNTALNGSAGMVAPDLEMGSGALGSMMGQMVESLRDALRNPVYRWGLGIESGVGMAMAALLCVAGVGLLRDRLWAIRLTRVWGVYALPAALITVVLQLRYVVPQAQPASPLEGPALMVAQAIAGGFMLLVLWLFPALLLLLLNRPVVLSYLRWRAGGPVPVSRPVPPTPRVEPSSSAAPRPDPEPPVGLKARSTPPSGPSPVDQTWRDDPWNDSSTR